MKIKNLSYYFLIFCKSVSAFASTDKSTSYDLSNVRIGVGIAGEYASINNNLKIRSPTKLGNISSTQQETCKKFQIAPSFELGTTIMNDYYLGFVVSWRRSGANTGSSISPIRGPLHFSHEFKLKSYIDTFIKPGYKLSPQTMIYGVVGPSIANWSHTSQQILIHAETKVTTIQDTFEMKEKTIGLGLGCGFEYLVKNKYALSFEYVSHTHRSKSASHRMTYRDGLQTKSGDLVKIAQPSYSTFAVRLTYFFSLS